jgi:methionyl-tRNA synthetase
MIPKKESHMKHKKLITTAIAYANAAPHIGHAFEFIVADVHARCARKYGDDVFFITGMDEHGQKIEQKAQELNLLPYDFVATHADTFKELHKSLGISYDFFVRTSDKEKHYVGAAYLWNKLQEHGDIEKRTYTSLYCVGCEEFKTEKDLNEQGECPDHKKKPELVAEENYFFKLSKYTEEIKNKINSNELEIVPGTRKNEILALLARGLEDVSFSRPVSKVSWGIPVPGDDSQVMYVWCDALANYLTALGYGTEFFDEERWADTTHVIGKDILRFHAAIWPGMLLAAGLALPKKILVHGHITSGGHKMSKSLGNVINPQDLLTLFGTVTEYPGEVLRFILLHEIPSFDDGDMTLESLSSVYTSYLVNGFGNLTSRIMKLATTYGVTMDLPQDIPSMSFSQEGDDLKAMLMRITEASSSLDKKIQEEAPFKVVKVDEEKGKQMIKELLVSLYQVACSLEVFMPKTSATIIDCIVNTTMPKKPLFARLP